jgi:MFS family permease
MVGLKTRTPFTESLGLLRTRRFGTFWFASLLSNIGTWAQQVAEPWLLLSLGASPFLVGLDSFAMSAPAWLLTLPGGVLADRADRRRVITAFQSVQMLCPTLVVVLLLAAEVRPWAIIVLSLIVGITDALSMPSFSSIVPSMVARDQISAGLALNSTQFNISRIAGPALAGVLMASVGVIGCFIVSAASYIPFIGVALWILPHRIAARRDRAKLGVLHPFADAITVTRDPRLRGALLTALASGLLCAPLITFCPVLVRNTLHGDATQFSLTIGAFGIGGLLGGIGLLAVPAGRDRRLLSSAFAAAYGLMLVVVALDPWLWALPGLLVLAGISMSVTNTSTNTLVQTAALPHLRGQAVSLFMLVSRGGMALGSLAMGLSVSLLGVRAALLINGVLAMAVQAQIARTWLRSPAV